MSTRKLLNTFILSIIACIPMAGWAQFPNSWNGNGTTANWSDAANWDLTGGLFNLDTPVFPAGPTNSPVNTNDLSLTLGGIELRDTYEIWGNALIMYSNAPITATKDSVIHADLSYPDAVEDSANWNVTAGATLTVNGNINAPSQGNTNSGVGITGYARKTGNGTLRLTGSDNRFHSGMNLRAGTIVLDGATLAMTNQNFRLSASGTNTLEARLVMTNNASLTIGYPDPLSNAQLDLGFGDAGLTNTFDMESGTLTILGRGWVGLCDTANDVSVVNHNGGTIDCLRDNGPGVLLISGSGGGIRAEYNLNGGTLKTRVISKASGATTGQAVLNLNGGTLLKNSGGGNSVGNSFLSRVDEVNILDGGAIIDLGSNPAIITNQLNGVGSGGFTKRGSALMQFRGEFVTNTFDGPVVVEEGGLEIRHQYHLGDNTNTVVIASNAYVYANFNAEPNKEWYVNLVMEEGSELIINSQARPAGEVTANGPFTVSLTNFSSFLGSVTSGSPNAAMLKRGPGNLQLSGNQTYSLPGSNDVAQGILRLNGTVTLGSLNVESGATLEAAGTTVGPVVVKAGAYFKPGFNINITTAVMDQLTIENTQDGFGFYPLSTFQINSDLYATVTPDNLTPVDLNDQVAGLTSVTYGGDLTVTDDATLPTYAAGQTYKLFSAASYSGSFNGFVNLPFIVDPNLAWDTTRLAVDGTLRVISTLPTPTPEPLDVELQGGTNLVVSWTNPAWHLEAQVTTRADGLTSNWQYYPGTSPVTIPVTSTNVEAFFLRLAYP